MSCFVRTVASSTDGKLASRGGSVSEGRSILAEHLPAAFAPRKPIKDNWYRAYSRHIEQVGQRYGHRPSADPREPEPMPLEMLAELGFAAAAAELSRYPWYPRVGRAA